MSEIIKEDNAFDYVKPQDFFPSKDILNSPKRQKTNQDSIYNICENEVT